MSIGAETDTWLFPGESNQPVMQGPDGCCLALNQRYGVLEQGGLHLFFAAGFLRRRS